VSCLPHVHVLLLRRDLLDGVSERQYGVLEWRDVVLASDAHPGLAVVAHDDDAAHHATSQPTRRSEAKLVVAAHIRSEIVLAFTFFLSIEDLVARGTQDLKLIAHTQK